MINRFSSLGLLLALALVLPSFGQEGRPAAEDRGGPGAMDRGSSSVGSSGGGGVTSRGISAGDYSSTSSSVGRSDGGLPTAFSTGAGTTSSSGYSTPNLSGTSWQSAGYYYDWQQNFLWALQRRYLLDQMYFLRFSRNVEPLVTPLLMKLALREPLTLSARMLRAVDELETLVAELQAGDTSRRDEIAARTREIRDLAKKIRQDHSLTYLDKRSDKDLTKESGSDRLGLEAIKQLREAATDLHTQLTGMYNLTATSTISVQTLTQPSFGSLSKNIDKLSKVIEAAAKRS